MTSLNDIKILLKNRVGFRKPIDGSFDGISEENVISDSGLCFQDSHSMISINIIRKTQPIRNIDDDTFNLFLQNLRESNVLEVLNDVFVGESALDEALIINNISAFDKAIYLRMVLKVGQQILSSFRLNEVAYLSKENLGQLRLDVNGSNDNDLQNPNYPYHSGYTSRYRKEIQYIKTMFNNYEADSLEKVTLS